MNHGEAALRGPGISPLAASSSLPALSEAYAYCRQITRQSSSNFYYAFYLLSKKQHNALCALYAFCRFMDDIADQPEALGPSDQTTNREERQARLQARLLDTWREELRLCYANRPRHPISQALSDTIQHFPIHREHLAGIIDGVEMDLYRTRYQTFSELYDYCYHVASLVGLICVEIFGYRNAATRDYAVNLGVAFQLTNILRDVGEDARRNRIYLPREDLIRFGYTEAELCAGVYNDAFVQLMTFEGARAREYYQRAARFLAREDRRSLAAAEAMHLIYRRLLDTIIARKFQIFESRVALSPVCKMHLALRAWGRGRFCLLGRL